MKATFIEKMKATEQQHINYVQESFTMNELAYKHLQFELGCKFLEDTYGVGTAQYMRMATNKMFWNWWRIEYVAWEREFITEVDLVKLPITAEIYTDEMTVLVHDRQTSISYIEFLKIVKPRKPKNNE